MFVVVLAAFTVEVSALAGFTDRRRNSELAMAHLRQRPLLTSLIMEMERE